MSSNVDEWNRVVEAVASLATKLKPHVEQAAGVPEAEVNKALDCLGDAVDEAFDALRGAVQDPAVQEGVREVATRLRDALTNTLAEFGVPSTSATTRNGEVPQDATPETSN